MFKAKVPFKYSNKSGNIISVNSGDDVPDFKEWPYVCQISHINLGWIEEVAEEEKRPLEDKKGKGHNKK